MIALDTNVLVRLIARDEPEQLERAQRLLGTEVCYVSDTVLLETAWVLRSSYGGTREQIYAELMAVLGLPGVRVSDPERVRQVLEWYAEGLDFADAMHLAGAQRVEALVTFDRRFVRRAKGKGECVVREVDD